MKNSNIKSGFTILELLLSMAIIAILSVSAIVYFRGSIIEISLESTIKTFVASINTAKGRAMAGDRGMSWGVRAIAGINGSPGSFEFFATSTNNITSDPFVTEINLLPLGSKWSSPVTGNKEVLFEPLTGKTTNTVFDLSYDQTTYRIIVSQDGEVVVSKVF